MIITSVCMIICLLIVFYTVFSVLSDSIQKLIIQDFANDVHMNYIVLNTGVDKCKNGITSMESRSAIRLKTFDYLDGKIEFKELDDFVYPKYLEGVLAIDNLVVSERYLPDKTLLCGYKKNKGNDYKIQSFDFDTSVDYNSCEQTDDGLFLYTALNVLKNDDVIYGYEYLVFDMTEEMESLNTYEISSYIKNKSEIDKIVGKSEEIFDEKLLNVYFDDEKYYGISQITKNDYLVSCSTTDIIFAEYYENIDRMVMLALISMVVIFVAFSFIMVRISKRHLSKAHKRGDDYKELAHTDLLTDCFNRAYLQYWDDNIRKSDKEYLVLMVDINKLKYINDNFGHVEGDKAICLVARAFKESLREQDVIIRLGGDEFLILVDDIDHRIAFDIIKRAIDNLEKSVENTGFEIEFSKGHSVLSKDSDLTKAIEQADMLMYEDKRNKHFE